MNTIEKTLKGPKTKVLTITLNPVLDRTLYINNFQIGKTLIADEVKNYAGGKGVNVSRALKTMGFSTLASGIIPETGSGFYLSILDNEGIPHNFLKVKGNLRINTTIITNVSDSETHIREKGPSLSPADKDKFLKMIKETLPHFNAIAFSGSIPMGIDNTIYEELIRIASKNGLRTYLDSSGKPLKEGTKAKPFLVKPNLEEAEDLTGIKVTGKNDYISIIKKIHFLGINYVALSLGKNGLIFSSGRKCYHGQCTVERIINTVGSGDAALAGAIIGLEQGLSEKEITILSVCMGTANTQRDGACHFSVRDMENLIKRVKVNEIPL